ncbi:tyrosine-protein kinase domain-containing protein [Pleurocapsa sp. PCC 7319]|uniref:GumC family protein n=1 Tax=Pleurocapsa sp. PCC 7319 TaxID=118161 RepID=UPI000348A9DA|nr:tyrosine-protein kinase domain-containing protein [Pleurocapsa sp. PCC 7319]
MQKSLIDSEQNLLLPAQQELNIISILRTIKRNVVPIAGITALATAIAWYSNRLPTYTGNFQLLVEPVSSEGILTAPSTLTGSSQQVDLRQLEMDYSTIIALLKSPGMLSSIVQEIQTQYPKLSLEKLKDKLAIERLGSSPIEQTKIIQVNYQNSDPELVQLILEETAKKYLSYSLEERKTRIGQGVEFIEQQLPDLYNRVNRLQANLQNLQEQNQLIDPQSKGNNLLEQIRKLKTQKFETQNQLNKLKTLKESLQRQLKVNPDEAIAITTLSEDPNYKSLLEKYKNVESEIAINSVLYQVNSPNIQRLEVKRQNLLDLLAQERRRILLGSSPTGGSIPLLLNSQNSILSKMTQELVETINQIKQLEVQNNSLSRTINEFEWEARKIPQIARQYTQLQQELEIANRTLQQLLTQKDTLSVELAQSQVPWEIVSKPQLKMDEKGNPQPIPMNSEKKLLAALIGGLLAGIVATAFLEKSHNVFYTAEDIEETTKLPLLGNITWNDSPERLPNATNSGLLVKYEDSNHNPESIFESFRTLYTNLRFRFTEPPIRSLVLSSAIEDDEQPTIAWNLADTAAATGQKVLLVDATFSHPQLQVKSYSANKVGLSELLTNQTDLNQVIQPSSHRDNLFILASGQIPADSSKLLSSNQMQQLIEEFRQSFDLIIYNTSPILESMDSVFLATHTDGILMTAAINKTKKSLFTQALNQVNNFNLKLLGIISTQIL